MKGGTSKQNGGSPYSGLGTVIDIFRVREYFDAITRLRDIAGRAREDASFVRTVRRSMLRLPTEARPSPVTERFWTPFRKPASHKPERFALVATGGSGALASLVGVLQACDEVGLRPNVMSFASGAALFAFPIAAGKTPEEVARFTLELDPTDWVDPNWGGMAGIIPRSGRGFAGVVRGAKLEETYTRFLGNMTLGELEIPAYAPVWNIEHNRLEYVGPRTHPTLKVARAIRMAVSLPLFVDPVSWHGGSWCDGGIVDIFPVHPVLDIEEPCQAVIAVNCFYPPDFEGEDASGWRKRQWSVLDIADQVVTAQHVQLARENLRRLHAEVGTVMMIDPVPYKLVRRAGFYAQFLDHRDWPDFMRSGRTAALPVLRRHRRSAMARAHAHADGVHGARSRQPMAAVRS